MPKRTAPIVAFGTFLAIYTFSGIIGKNFEISFWSSISRMSGLLTWYHIGALVLVLAGTVKDSKTWNSIFSWSLCSAVAVAVLSYFEPAGLNVFTISTGLGSTLGNSSYAGIYLVVNLFFAFYFFHRSVSKKDKWKFGIMAVLILLSPILIKIGGIVHGPAGIVGESRAGLAALLVGLVVYLAMHYKNKWIERIVVCGVGAVIVLIVLLPFPGSVSQKLVREYSGARFLFWESAERGIHKHPLLGYGPENYSYAFYEFFPTKLYTPAYGNGAEANTDNPHNMYLNLGVQGGLLSLAAYLALLLFIFKYLLRPEKEPGRTLFFAMIVSVMVYNIFFFDTLVSLLMLALAVGYVSSENQDYPKTKPRSVWWLFPLVIIPIWLFVITPYRALTTLNQVFVLPNDISLSELFSSMPNGRNSALRYLADKTLVGYSAYSKNAEDMEIYKVHVTRLYEAMKPYVGKEYRLLYSFDRVSLLQFIITKNEKILREVERDEQRLQQLSPDNPEVYLLQAQREILEGGKESAVKILKESLRKWPDIEVTQKVLEKIEKYNSKVDPLPFFI